MDFNTVDHLETGGEFGEDKYSLLAKGIYKYVIGKAEIKETKAKNGNYLNVMFQVIEGDRSKTCVFKMFNLNNPNQQAVEIGKKQLASLTNALGIASLTDEQTLVGKEVWGDTYIREGKGDWKDSNDIGAFKSADWKPEVKEEGFSDTDKVVF